MFIISCVELKCIPNEFKKYIYVYYYCLRTMDFYTKLETSPNILLRFVYNADGLDDISRLACMFECDSKSFKEHYKSILTDYFNATI